MNPSAFDLVMSKGNEMKSSDTKFPFSLSNLNGRFYRVDEHHPPQISMFLCRNEGGVPHLKFFESFFQACK